MEYPPSLLLSSHPAGDFGVAEAWRISALELRNRVEIHSRAEKLAYSGRMYMAVGILLRAYRKEIVRIEVIDGGRLDGRR
jgi:hypothetical protein